MSNVFILTKIFQVYFSGVFAKSLGGKMMQEIEKASVFFFSVTNLCLTSEFQMLKFL